MTDTMMMHPIPEASGEEPDTCARAFQLQRRLETDEELRARLLSHVEGTACRGSMTGLEQLVVEYLPLGVEIDRQLLRVAVRAAVTVVPLPWWRRALVRVAMWLLRV